MNEAFFFHLKGAHVHFVTHYKSLKCTNFRDWTSTNVDSDRNPSPLIQDIAGMILEHMYQLLYLCNHTSLLLFLMLLYRFELQQWHLGGAK